LERLLTRTDSQRYVLCKYNIHRDKFQDAARIAPGMRNPTVTTLHPEESGWVAVEVMVEQKQVADKMDELWVAGAHDILILPLLNTRTSD
jgi:ATP phosphoribosyltransferase-like protein